jgi:hypothetical protein
MDDRNYLKFYDDESYLMGEVADRFHKAGGTIEPADFYMLLIWKSNRAKNYQRDRLKHKAGSFQKAVSEIASALKSSVERRERLRILIQDWEFSLPAATAILTILYPTEFTVYDYRVCDEIDHKYRPYLCFSDSLWAEYEEFHRKVENEPPAGLCLRDKDRFLTGRSNRMEIESDCNS